MSLGPRDARVTGAQSPPGQPDRSRPAPESDGSARARDFFDSRGRRWTVTEELTPADEWTSADVETHAAGYPVGWLRFDGDESQKRLRLFPPRWQTLADADLDRLCHSGLAPPERTRGLGRSR